jgi:hypothetical protein
MTAPQHRDALLELIQERSGAVGADLLALVERVRTKLVELSLDPTKLTGPALDKIVNELLRAINLTAAATSKLEGREVRSRVLDLADYRSSRLQTFARILTGAERPTLGAALLVLRQAEAFASDMRMVISDHQVAKANAAVLEQANRRWSMVAMWVPERDACARCLAYAGLRLLRPGDEFPGGLSYVPEERDSGAGKVAAPPLHPRCRCELQLVRRGDSEAASAALKREADRSIVRGFALESEGDARRRRAAKALLASGVNLPKSVKADARRRLQQGETFTRPVPDGSGT